ncbi:peroxisomal biogenesis factor 11 [Entophlyctis helioformis]|nr:peroxisomal biogenesis factor 11 [Entophlyctis helioformis]
MGASAQTLDKLCRFLNSVRGTDKALMLVQYSSKLFIWLLKHKDAKSPMAGRIANLAGPVSDFRILLRYYGLLPLIQWIIHSEKNPSPSPTIQTLTRLQNLVNVAYYPLEHVYWLALHQVIPMSEKTRDKIGMWSCRFWATYVLLYFYQLYEEKKILDTRSAALKRAVASASAKKVSAGGPDAAGSADVDGKLKAEKVALRQDYNALTINTLINAAYFPLTIHWSLESSSFPDVGVGLFGSIAAVAQIYTAWKAT